uniref:Uncharacterized protein n=1 Tax=Cyclophora tenuis TaxID=216820 RepID=A0A7S1GH55_CYCTE|mmetsp:Transcript_13849/g.23579  ORF Transcript_13849/g.23579 Transcript_13849/m.23579 type:complete len:160 (+) Transcript_13849:53-532(+)
MFIDFENPMGSDGTLEYLSVLSMHHTTIEKNDIVTSNDGKKNDISDEDMLSTSGSSDNDEAFDRNDLMQEEQDEGDEHVLENQSEEVIALLQEYRALSEQSIEGYTRNLQLYRGSGDKRLESILAMQLERIHRVQGRIFALEVMLHQEHRCSLYTHVQY